jgi:FkbM family methyltransferase
MKFLKKLAFYLRCKFDNMVRQVLWRCQKYLDNRHQKAQEKKQRDWNLLFDGKSSIAYKLKTENLILNLYKDSKLSREIYNGFEDDEINFLKQFLKPGDTFVDIGANIGLFSLIASFKIGQEGKVISFEPSPVTYDRLIENIELNSITNIDARNLGISDKPGQLLLQQSETGFDAWNTFAPAENEKFQYSSLVDVSTLDLQLKEANKSKIPLIKIDVEGWEKFVLEGASDVINNYSPVFMIEFTETNTFNAGYMVQELFTFLQGFGYKWFNFQGGILKEEKMRLHYPYNNLIAAKEESVFKKRLKAELIGI